MVEKLKEQIRGRIRQGTLEEGDLLPSVATLCERYNRSEGVVRKSIRDLINEGVLVRRGGDIVIARDGRENVDLGGGRYALTYKLQRHRSVICDLKERARKRGCILTAHDGVVYNKHPDLERELLKKLRRQGYKGVGLFATPLFPRNVDLYHQLRAEGMKVALLAPPEKDVTNHVAFLPNYRLGGYVAVNELAQRGFQEIFLVGPEDSLIYKEWISEGARTAERNLAVDVMEIRKNVVIGEEPPTIGGETLQDWFLALDSQSAVVTFETRSATVFEDLRREASKTQKREKIGTVCCFFEPCQGYEHMPRVGYDYALLLEYTYDYLLDDHIPADTLIHEWIDPVFEPGHLDE